MGDGRETMAHLIVCSGIKCLYNPDGSQVGKIVLDKKRGVALNCVYLGLAINKDNCIYPLRLSVPVLPTNRLVPH